MVGPKNLWRMKRNFQINFLLHHGLQPYHNFLDIGFGTLRGGIPLIRYLNKDHYWGTEVREEVVEEAKKELEEEGLLDKNPNLVIGNGTHLPMFDYIWAFSVLFHMNETEVINCIELVSGILKQEGIFLANVLERSLGNSRWKGFPMEFRSIEWYNKVARKYGLSVEFMGTLRECGHITNTNQDEQIMLRIIHV